MSKLPTVEDVALVAGVSRQTVSNVINTPEIVREATRERVQRAIAELGYRPHMAARRLRTQRSSTIGIHLDPYAGGISGVVLDRFVHALTERAGDLLPRERLRSALAAVVEHNHRSDLTAHESTQRVYALNDEGGLLLASWPRGGRPAIPFVYSDEVWTGIEHQVAASLVYAGLADEALLVERTLRARYDGEARNPWNEIECGNHYARSLASWGLLLAFSGAQWDAPARTLSFDPASDGPFRSLFTAGDAWGRVEVDDDELTLHVDGGTLVLDSLLLSGRALDTSASLHLTAGQSVTARATAEAPDPAPQEIA